MSRVPAKRSRGASFCYTALGEGGEGKEINGPSPSSYDGCSLCVDCCAPLLEVLCASVELTIK